jgi:nicotinic acid mononucleotide adenylyltransferase
VKNYVENHKFKASIIFIEAEDWKDEYSSTKIRTMLLNGEKVDHLTDEKIVKYINAKKLWLPQNKKNE